MHRINLSPTWFFLALCSLTLSAITSAQIYKYQDDEGNLIYSDRPPPDDEDMAPTQLPDIIIQPEIEVPEESNRDEPSSPRAMQISISSPENEATIHRGQNSVSVSAQASRPLVNGETAILLVNGNAFSRGRTLSWNIANLERGQMVLVVEVRTPYDELVATTDPVTVYVQRPIAN